MDTVDPTRFVFAFLFVVGLIGIMAIVLRRSTGLRKRLAGGVLHTAGEPGRLQIVEIMYLDTKRRLMIVRRDDAEHLLLLADGRETVIESNIRSPMMKPNQTNG